MNTNISTLVPQHCKIQVSKSCIDNLAALAGTDYKAFTCKFDKEKSLELFGVNFDTTVFTTGIEKCDVSKYNLDKILSNGGLPPIGRYMSRYGIRVRYVVVVITESTSVRDPDGVGSTKEQGVVVGEYSAVACFEHSDVSKNIEVNLKINIFNNISQNRKQLKIEINENEIEYTL